MMWIIILPIVVLADGVLVLWKLGVPAAVRYSCFVVAIGLAVGLFNEMEDLDETSDYGEWGKVIALAVGALIALYLTFRRDPPSAQAG